MNTAWQRLHAAALVLARSGSVKDRLQTAYREHLAQLEPSLLPIEVRGDFLALTRDLTREAPMRGEDAVSATIRKLSSRDVDEMASTIIEIFGYVSMHRDSVAQLETAFAAAPAAAAGGNGRVVPLFAEARP